MTHSRETVTKIYDIFEETGSRAETARRLGISLNVVKQWLKNPARNDPYLDMVAVERALLGERKVFEALTSWEETEVFSRVRDIIYADGMNEPDRSAVYALYSQSWGVPIDTIQQRVFRFNARAGAAA